MKKQLTVFVVLVTISFPGCYHYRVTVPETDPVTEYESKTMHTFFWGLVNDPEKQAAYDCVSNSIDEVRVSTNYGYALITVVTLGIWVPMDVEWRCGKVPIDDTEEPL